MARKKQSDIKYNFVMFSFRLTFWAPNLNFKDKKYKPYEWKDKKYSHNDKKYSHYDKIN